MVVSLRRLLPGLALGAFLTVLAMPAAAADYVVVRSSDPGIPRGQGFDAGAKVALGASGTITLMHASGDVVTLKGAMGGISLPRRAATPKDADRMAVLRFILAPAPRETGARATRATRTRGGICPPAEALTTLDAIVQVQQGGCADEAAKALDAFLDRSLDAAPDDSD